MLKCDYCGDGPAALRRSSSGLPSCKACFIESFENEIFDYIKKSRLIVEGDKVCIGVSGGKDSSVLAHVLSRLKEKHGLDWTLYMLAIDEGIKGYRDDSLRVVEKMYERYRIELKILNFKDRFGFTMDQVVSLIGKKNNCTVCGSFRRQILEIGSRLFGANVLCTGHNADDMAETVLLNLFRGDLHKLASTVTPDIKPDPQTAECSDRSVESGKYSGEDRDTGNPRKFRRIKPLMYSFEKEIVLYARFMSLDYFSTECIYSPEAYRGHMRSFIKNLEILDPRIILNIIKSGGDFYSDCAKIEPDLGPCRRCGVANVKDVCKPCVIIERLNVLKIAREGGESMAENSAEGLGSGGMGERAADPGNSANGQRKWTDSGVTSGSKHTKSISKLLLSSRLLELEYENES